MTVEQQNATVVFESGQRYACTDCKAKCCRNPWKIPVTQDEAAKLRSIPWVNERLKAAGVDFVADGAGFKLPRVDWNAGGQACVFLDEDNLCSIHKAEGHELIPKTCQDYPFSFIEDRNGSHKVYSATSFFCRAILYNYGSPLGEMIETKFQQWREHHVVPTLPETATLGGLTLPKEAYMALADQLEKIFANPELSAAESLLAGRRLMWEVITANHGQAAVSAADIRKTGEMFMQNLDEQKELPVVSPRSLIGRAILAMELIVVASEPLYLQHKAAGKPEKSFRYTYIGQLLRMIQDQGQLMLWDFPKAANLNKARSVKVDESNPELQAYLRRYYLHLLRNRHMFCQEADFLKTYFRLGSSYPIILKLSRYLASARDRETATAEDYIDAIGYADLLISSKSRAGDDWFAKVREVITDILATRQDSFERLLLTESLP